MVSNSIAKLHETTLDFVDKYDLAKVYPGVRAQIDEVAIRSRATWNHLHVFSFLHSGNATLHIARRAGRDVGFVVLCLFTDQFNGKQWMIVWLAYSKIAGVVDECLPIIERMAREQGLAGVKLQSPRKGWIRRLIPFGFRVRDYVIEKEF